ncbi:hypothetical protein ATE49_13855 [Elizabethkingia miricola]|uniref:Glycosyltransferase involved in cell wall biosynthesis n=1 Tax=Elizabethkingia miricola TaxID=172045 RepID=A0ABY3NE36_ELIMR|nr:MULTISPECIES: glycosyltransferase [Elizabethkingia]OBS13145.1 hypothetical protein ATE49_13855 [Elizabethkingia miricola]TYO89754.1 glycosyltransferase involved in cell wall biosynthesis [Elizabethkingia miricola]
MKVLMINTVCGYGSTGSICTDIANALENEGNECFIAYGQGTTSYRNSYKIGTVLENHLHNLGSRIFGKQGYFTKTGTKKLINFIKVYKPDVIHLHNLHGNYLNLDILFEYLKDFSGKVFWTFHDCWPFTGKCAHYTSVGCYKWQSHCQKCPQIKEYPPSIFFDKSFEMFEDKYKRFLSVPDLKIITVSDWLKHQVEKSFFKKNKIRRIYNWVDHNTFSPKYGSDIVENYQIQSGKFTVLCVSASWSIDNSKLQDLLSLANSLQGEDIQIIMIGVVIGNVNIPDNVISINYIGDKDSLAQLYSFSDVYLHLSSEDTFGKVIAEALSCGTPAIVYNSTACPEIIDSKTGIVVEDRNIESIKKSILKIKNKEVIFTSLDCRERVLENFDINKNINKTIDWYRE